MTLLPLPLPLPPLIGAVVAAGFAAASEVAVVGGGITAVKSIFGMDISHSKDEFIF